MFTAALLLFANTLLFSLRLSGSGSFPKPLSAAEEQEYLQKVAAYINEKIGILKAQPGFTRQNKDYQEVMIYLNLADDYFKALQEAKMLKAQRDDLEREIYSLKHELISVQMKLDAQTEQ